MYRNEGKIDVMRLNGVFRSTSRDSSPDRGVERRSAVGDYKMQGLERGRAPSRTSRRREPRDDSSEESAQELEDQGDAIEVDEEDDEQVSMDVEEDMDNMDIQEHKPCSAESMGKYEGGTKRKLAMEADEAGPSTKNLRKLPSDESHSQENEKTATGAPLSRKSNRLAIKKGSSESR